MLRPYLYKLLSIAAVGLAAATSLAQDFPLKPIRIVTSEAGGASDFATRLITSGLSAIVGQPVIVDNRPAGAIPGEIVSRAPADGYTLLSSANVFWIGTLLQKMPYEMKDFSAVSLAAVAPGLLVVNPGIAANSVKDLIELARRNPGKLNYASGPSGAINHLAVELMKSMAKVDIVRIPFKGGGPAVNALIAGQVQLMVNAVGVVMPHVKTGRLKALGVTTAQPSELAPNLPTISASGLPGYESASTYGIFAPARTAPARNDQLSRQIARVLSQSEVKQKFFDVGVESVGGTPGQLSAVVGSDIVKWAVVIKERGITAE